MSLTEKAWKWAARKGWDIFSPTDSDDETLNNVQLSLQRLSQLRLPIAAIDEIETLMSAHEQYLENGELRKVGQIPTHRVSELLASANQEGYEFECTLLPDNNRFSVVRAFGNSAEVWFRGWIAAKREF